MWFFSGDWRLFVTTLGKILGYGLVLLMAIPGCNTEQARTSPASLRELRLTDQHGEAVNTSEFGGHVLLLNFMFTRCPGPCPRLTQLLAKTRSQLPSKVRERVRLLSISVDPEHDTPDVLDAFAKSQSVDVPEWRFARISAEQLNLLSQRLMVFDPGSAPEPSAHSMRIYLFDGDGRPLQHYDGNVIESGRLAREVVSADAISRAPD